jgi:hypothetical protein
MASRPGSTGATAQSNAGASQAQSGHQGPSSASSRQGDSSSGDGPSPPPPVSLPTGGGAIKGIGEKFSVNANTGSGSLTIPLPFSTARAHSPKLSITYSPGYGNSPFGVGWGLPRSKISRKTDKGLPRYFDNNDNETDVFVADEEDLVPVYQKDKDGNPILVNGQRQYVDTTTHPGYAVRTYMHRVEQQFLRIERWTDVTDPTQIHWRKIDNQNVTFIFGLDDQSRIYDSSDDDPQSSRIFSWLLTEYYGPEGNAVVYTYKQEDSVGVPTTLASDRNRHPYHYRYLKSIKYGNQQPNRDPTTWTAFSPSQLPDSTWMFTVVFDYGEHSATHPTPTDNGNWLCRQDPYSSYRSTFEIRVYRLCQRILMFHHFPDQLGQQDVLVRSLNFTYDQNPSATYLTSITQFGYLLDSSGNYQSNSFPPLDLTYSKFPTDEQLSKLVPQDFDPQTLRNLPQGVDGSTFQWIDLDGEGLSGIFSQSTAGAFYKHNQSVQLEDKKPRTPEFGSLRSLPSFPSVRQGGFQLLDLGGDGHVDVVESAPGRSGYYTRVNNTWSSFRQFQSFPNIDFSDPYLRYMDLTGNGLADIIISQDQVFTWYQSAGYKGFLAASISGKAAPHVVFADAKEKIYFADMTGDGLSDIVRIRNGSVVYWPNMGYGRFGGMIRMGNAPFFDAVSSFDQRYILLADVDGSGTTDILYLKAQGVEMYLNQSGNTFADGKQLPVFPPIDNIASVNAIDLFGSTPFWVLRS